MKKNYLVLLCLLFFGNSLFAQSSLCPSEGEEQNYEWVTRIKIADGEEKSGKVGYMDFTDSAIATLTAGETYPVEIDVNTDDNPYNEYVKLWLDANQDNEIQDPSELVYVQASEVTGFHTFTGEITIPSTAYSGSMIIRMIMQFNADPALCGSYTYGTTYDVKVNVVGGTTNPDNYNLTVSTTGAGAVTSDPEGIATALGITSFDFPAGTNVTLTAAPNTDAEFSNWSGDASGTKTSYSLVLDEDSNVLANFTTATPAPVINTDPSNRDICFGDNTTFSITATGATSYQWQVNTESGFINLSNGGVYSDVTTNTLKIIGATDVNHGKQYRCVVTNTSESINSNIATLTVTHITANISSQTDVSCPGKSDGAATVIGEGGTGNYTYLWSNGATTASIADVPAGTYTVEVFGDNGCKGTASVTIATTPDNTAPVSDVATLAEVTVECEVKTGMITAPTATDNCAGVLTATTSDPLTYTEPETYTITWTYDDGNGNTATQTQNVIVEASPLDAITFDDATFVYNGSIQNIEVNGLPASATVAYTISHETGTDNGAINAGEYTVTATISSENATCPDIVLTANLTIEKAPSVITAVDTQTFTYDGTSKEVTATLNHSEATLTYSPQLGYTDAGTYTVTVASAETDNYEAASKEVSLVIEKAEITGVTFGDKTFTYNGNEHSIAVSGLPQGAEVNYANNGQTSAGEYEVKATVTWENYNDVVLTADLTIDKAKAVITSEAVQTFTYDGAAKNVAASLHHSETALTYTPQQGYTDAGTYTVTVASAETDNYEAASKEVSLVIEKAEITGVTFDDETFTYNGNEHSIAVSGLPQGAEVNYANNGQTNAGTYTVTATVSQENFVDEVLSAVITIDKAAAVITSDETQTFIYDGTSKEVVANLNHTEAVLSYSPQLGYTNAGTYAITVYAEETDNYLAASKEVSLVIEPAIISGVTLEDANFTFNGDAHSISVNGLPEGASVVYDNNDKTNAGTYTVTVTVSQENFVDEVLSAVITIDKAAAVITAKSIQTFTYDGTSKEVISDLNHTEAALSYSPQLGYTNAGIYAITVSAAETDNYLAVSKEVNLVIEPAEIAGVTFEGERFTYDGTEHSIIVSGLPEGATVTYSNNGQTNAGTYPVTATLSQDNFNDKVLTADLVINKAEALITADAVQTFTYDGTAKEVTVSLNHAETALSYAPGQSFTNAGTHPVTISSEETDNYLSASKEVSLVIENAEITGVAFEGKTVTFNDEAQSLAVTGLPQGASVTYDNNDQINAGTYTVTATLIQENFNNKILTADLVINKAEALITADAVQTFIYDGSTKEVTASLNHSETSLGYIPRQSFTNAGTYPITISSEETDNYLAASKEISLVIENAEIPGVAFEGSSFTYEGTEHSLAVTGLPQGASVTYDNNDKIKAGTYTVTATVSQENFNNKILTADLIINKAEALITADAVQNFTYDGTAKEVTASLNHSETALSYGPGQSFTNAGTYPITISSEETDNYLSASKEVSLVIENAEITGVALEGKTVTFNDEAHSIYVSGTPQGASVTYDNNGQINAGTYTVTATVSQENFNNKILTADLIINKAEALITADAVQTFTYDGSAKEVTASLNHAETTLSYAPGQSFTNSGTYPVTISAEETDNYLSASKEVSLVIENAEITGVAFERSSFTYDGTEHSIYVSGVPQGANVTYENNGQINAGTYTVTATLSQENFVDKILTADLVIEKAVQSLSFDEIADRNLEADADFQLQATSTSGLPVSYSYTYETARPAASVSESGFVSLLETGTIRITANQEGNQNYEAATPVTRTLKIGNSEARLDTVVINGTTYSNPSEEIFYLIGCGSEENEVEIQLAHSSGSSVDQEIAFRIPTPNPGIYRESISITSEDGSLTRSYTIKIEKTFDFEDVVEQKFNNVMLVNNNPQTNGGYRFVNFEWYKDGKLISTGQYFSEGTLASDQIDPESDYHVVMTTEEGDELRTCPTRLALKSSYKVMLSKNPLRRGEPLELIADLPQQELESMQISIHNLNGAIIRNIQSNKKHTTIELPTNLEAGVYILVCRTSTRNKNLKFIVY